MIVKNLVKMSTLPITLYLLKIKGQIKGRPSS